MERKTKINVLLPFKMVGELERLSKLGKRSDFIMKAVRSKLDGEDAFDLEDIATRRLARYFRNRDECPEHLRILINLWLEEVFV